MHVFILFGPATEKDESLTCLPPQFGRVEMQAPAQEPDQQIEPTDVYSGERLMGNMMTINHRCAHCLAAWFPPSFRVDTISACAVGWWFR